MSLCIHSICLDLYQASIDQVPEIIRTLRSKNFTLMTAAQCQNDINPHYITDDSLKLQPANQTLSAPSTTIATSSVAWTISNAAPTTSSNVIPPPVVVVKENIYKEASFNGSKSTSDAISSITKSALLALALSFASLLTL